MTEFNPDYVAAHPFKFALTITEYGVRAFLLSIRRFINPFASQPTTYVTALKSLLLRTVLARDHQFIYSTPKSAYDGTRRIDGNGWEAYEVAADPGRLLQDYHAVVLYFHGGGYIIGDPLVYHSTYRRWKAKASRRGLRLALVPLRYPLTGDAPHPAQRNAALEAYEYLIEKEKVPPSHIILAGDSAGGHLAASVIHYMKDHPEIPRPGGTILISAWLDPSLENTLTSPFADIDYVYPGGSSAGAQYQARQFAGEGRDVADPEISLARDKDLKGVPPHLCIYGKVEVLEEHSRKWIENCKASGVDVIEYAPKGGIHIFPMGGFTADSRLEAESDEVVLNYIAKSVGFVEGSS